MTNSSVEESLKSKIVAMVLTRKPVTLSTSELRLFNQHVSEQRRILKEVHSK